MKYFHCSFEKKANVDIFLSACKELKVKTILKYETIERLKPTDWLELVQTLQSLSAKIERERKDEGPFEAFKLDGKAVKEMIKRGKAEPESSDPSKDIYGPIYRDPKYDAKRVSLLLEVITNQIKK